MHQKFNIKKQDVFQRPLRKLGGEQPGNNVPDNTIKNICMSFGVNEDWLRNGTEPMYIQTPTFSLDDFVRQRGGTDLEIDIMKA